MKNMPDTFSIDYACLQISPNISFRNSDFIMFLGHSSKQNRQTCKRKHFPNQNTKNYSRFCARCPLWYESVRLVETSTTCQCRQLKLNPLSTQINIYCLMTNQMPPLLVQRAPWTRAAVMLLQSLNFSRSPTPRAIIPDACPLDTFENQDSRNGKKLCIQNRGLWTV